MVLLAATVAACAPDPADLPPTVLELRTAGSRTVFMPDSISAKAGSPVVIRLINEGEVAHNLVVVRDEEAVEPIVLAAYRAIKTEYVPMELEDDMLGATTLVYPGETEEISFLMPEPGEYTYVCVFPSHGITMRGTLYSVP